MHGRHRAEPERADLLPIAALLAQHERVYDRHGQYEYETRANCVKSVEAHHERIECRRITRGTCHRRYRNIIRGKGVPAHAVLGSGTYAPTVPVRTSTTVNAA